MATASHCYANQDAAEVTFSAGNSNRLNASDHTGATYTVTSDGTPFPADIADNYIVINAGGNWSGGYYWVKSRNSSSSIELDRDPTNGSNATAGTGALGGAFASPKPLSTGSDAGAPTITTPLAAGHVVYVQGTADTTLQDLPDTATYTWSTNYTFPIGSANDAATGMIKFLATGGIVRLDIDDTFAAVSGHIWQGWHFVSTANSNMMFRIDTSGTIVNSWIYDSVFDQNGYGNAGTNVNNLIGVGFINSDAGGLVAAVSAPAYSGAVPEVPGTTTGRIMGCSFVGWKTQSGSGTVEHPNWLTIEHNLFVNNTSTACIRNGTVDQNSSLFGNTFYGCSGDAILLYHYPVEFAYLVRNNLIVNSGGYGLNLDNTDDGHIPARYNLMPDYNAYYNNNGGGTGLDISALATHGPHDACASGCATTLSGNPFVNAVGLDFRLNTTAGAGLAVTGIGWPRFFVGVAP